MPLTDNTDLSPSLSNDGDFLPDLCGPQAVLALILIAELFVGALMIAAYSFDHFDWARFGMVSILAQWVVLTSAGSLCLLRRYLNQVHPMVAGMGSYSLVLFCTFVFSFLTHWIGQGNFYGIGQVLIGNLMVAAVLAGVGLRYLYLQQQLRNQQRAEMASRLQALQSRIRPHFLFNSMNTIASLIAVDQDTAERVVVELAQLFRASLSEPGLIPLRKEIDLCRYYMDIEQMRLGERLRIEWAFTAESGGWLDPADERFDHWQIPSFLLQPLFENAIYHGIQPLPCGGMITVNIVLGEKQAVVSIRNPVGENEDKTQQLDKPEAGGNGIALDNIRHRLVAYYGSNGTLVTNSDPGEFIAVLSFPNQTLQN